MSDMTVAVLVEHRAGDIARPSLEVLTLARTLGNPVAVWIGEEPSSSAVDTLGAYGASEVRWVEGGPAMRLSKVRAARIGSSRCCS